MSVKLKHYVHETGSDFLLDCGVLIDTATAYYINYKKPSGVIGTWEATVHGTYSALAQLTGSYFLRHTLAYGDLDIPGDWKFQAWVAAPAGTWWGEAVTERIYDQFE